MFNLFYSYFLKTNKQNLKHFYQIVDEFKGGRELIYKTLLCGISMILVQTTVIRNSKLKVLSYVIFIFNYSTTIDTILITSFIKEEIACL